MKASSIMFTLLVACAGMLACSEAPTAPNTANQDALLETVAFSAGGAVMTPIAFVTTDNGQGCAIPGFEDGFRENGESGRAKLQFTLSFDITGDLVGSSCVYIDANLTSPTGPQEFFTIGGYAITTGCIPSRGICGSWEERTPGRIEFATGLASRNHGSMVGIEGDAIGTTILIQSFLECNPPGAGCAEAVLVESGRP
jgi:hypothetical protein